MLNRIASKVTIFLINAYIVLPLWAGTIVTKDDYAATNANNTPRTLSNNASIQSNGQNSGGNDGVNDTSYLRLIPGKSNQSGFCANNVTVNDKSDRVTIDFDVRCMNGTATPGDGMGVALLNVNHHGTSGVVTWAPGERPSLTGSIGIGLNVRNGGVGGTQLSVFFNNSQVGNPVLLSGTPFNYNLYRGTEKPNTLPYDHFTIEVNFVAATVSVTIKPAGSAPINVLSNLTIPNLSHYRWRIGMGASSGGSHAIFDVDNLIARDSTRPNIDSANSPLEIPEDTVNVPLNLIVSGTNKEFFTYTILPPTNGTMSGIAPNLTYTPFSNFFGIDEITLIATDSNGIASEPFTLPITVTSLNDGPPIVNSDSGSTTDGLPLTIDVLKNDIVVDRPFNLTIVTSPQNGTAIVNPDHSITYLPNPGFVGEDSLIYRVVDFENELNSATVSISVAASPPNIHSALSVSVISTLPLNYAIKSTGTQPISYSATALPQGLVLVGSTLQGFLQPGSYVVTLTASNKFGTDQKTLVINAISLVPGVDTDGDGFSDELEILAGSDPLDAHFTPYKLPGNEAGKISSGVSPAKAQQFFVSRSGLKINLNFASDSLTRDTISLRGSLPLPAGFSAQSQPVTVFVGGAGVNGMLDNQGKFTSEQRTAKIQIVKMRTSLAGRNSPLSVTLRGLYAGNFIDEGYVNENLMNTSGSVEVHVLVGNMYFSATAKTQYSAKVGRSGKVKAAR